MSDYLFIETRDPFTFSDTRFVVETAVALKQNGHNVTVFFIQNGVFALRKNIRASAIPHLLETGVKLLADDFSLRERGILSGEVAHDIQPSNIETLVELLVEENTKAIWH